MRHTDRRDARKRHAWWRDLHHGFDGRYGLFNPLALLRLAEAAMCRSPTGTSEPLLTAQFSINLKQGANIALAHERQNSMGA
jgi:hypothetical protein